MKTRFLSIVLIAALAISTTTMAQNHKPVQHNPEQKDLAMKKQNTPKQDRFENFFTEEQLTKVKELRLETAKQIKPLRNELNELKAKQQTLTTADNADMKAINNNIDKMSKVKADLEKVMAKQHQEIRSMLSEEQLIKFDAMRNKKGNRNGDFGRRGMERENKNYSGGRS
ncbi:periplasmic heavy metal sensor [Prolixibacteraceae bacterium Z1-6]|uniref:Periplasmic heavy metal sensor n=1 Tax=Draconibacterium aestuarii TaxID=2998507 RepID=A0A9X3FDL6_9BACT|nr:periplasmic heavy metal sensor [Prolixibacteraceae bacterium Z1-6]